MRNLKDLRGRLVGYAVTMLTVCICFVMFSVTAFAAEGKVTASAAKIRKEASTGSEAIGSAANGQKFTITGETTGSDGKVWYQITFDGNKTGYIRSDLMEKSGETATQTPSTNVAPSADVEKVQPVSAKITGATVRVRSAATTEGSTIIANVVKDSVVTITGRAKDNQNKTWYLVSFSSDTGEVTGYIREDFLSVSGTISPLENVLVEEDPVETDKPVTEPEPTQKPVITDPYYLVEDNGEWFLVDKEGGYQYGAESLIDAALNNPKVFEEYSTKIKSQKAWIMILVILVAALGIAVTMLFLKLREVMDEAYFTAIEKETIRQRQGQKANNPSAARNKNVMHTVGNGENRQGTAKTVNKSGNSKPVQQRTAGTPQTVKVSNPAETNAPKARVQQNRPANVQQKTAGNAVQQKTVTNGQGTQSKSAVPNPKPVKQTEQKTAEVPGKQTWQSKNFVAEEEDEFEFEFLNWDGNDED